MILAKRLTVIEKKEIVNLFINGQSIDELSKKFTCAKSTIIRNLKNTLDIKEYNFLINKNKTEADYENNSQQEDFKKTKKELTDKEKNRLITFGELKSNLSKIIAAINLGVRNLTKPLNFFNFKINNQNIISKKWVRNDKNDNIKV